METPMEFLRSRSRSRSPTKPKLGQHLFSKLKRGSGLDVFFLVGVPPHQTRVGAHKLVLVVMSDVFETKLEERWTPGDTIELPQGISENAVHVFIKYMYTEKIEFDQSIETLLQVLILADMYNVFNLLEECEELLDKRIAKDNCAQIYESTFLIASCKNVSQEAFFVLKGLVGKILRENDEDACSWLFSTWEQILQSSLPNVKEITLFEGLVKWLNWNNDERKEDFDKLMKLIRFPLMGTDTFVKKVIPSCILQQKDVLDILIYFAEDGDKHETCFSSQPRNIILAPDTSSFKRLLTYVAPGDTIQLAEATYEGPFQLVEKNITIIGAGTSKTTITNIDTNKCAAGILIKSDNCKIAGLKITSHVPEAYDAIDVHGNHNVFQDLLLDGTQNGLHIWGKFNSALNIVATNIIGTAFNVMGDSNKLTTIEVRNVESYAQITGGNNSVKNFNCFDSMEINKTGIEIESINMNEIEGMQITRTASVQNDNTRQKTFCAVKLLNGNEHVIKGVQYEGYFDNINPICTITLEDLCTDSVIKDCSLTRIHIEGGQNHRIVNCKARALQNNGTNVHIVNCNFDLVMFG